MSLTRRKLLTGLTLAPLGAPSSAGLEAASRPGPRAGFFPDVALRTHLGKTVRFYDDLIKGKIVVINFMYAHCEALCPRQTKNLVEAQRLLGDRVGRDIFIYSLTLDPNRDTPGALRKYAKAFGVGPGWLFLTGSEQDIELLRRRLGFVDPDPAVDRDRTQHIGVVLYGNEALDRWAACPALTDASEIARYILWMEPLAVPVGRPSNPILG